LLAAVDEAAAKSEPVLVTKNGKPVAKLVPLETTGMGNPLARFLFPGKVEIVGDIMSPVTDLDGWNALK